MIQCSCAFRQLQMARFIFIVLSLAVVAYGYSDGKDCGCNEAKSLCGRMCEPSCQNRHPPSFSCPRIQCTKATESCRCRQGYLRNEGTKECVRPDDCPVSTTMPPVKCAANEQLGNCGRICDRTCSDQVTNKCSFTSCAGVGCQCKDGYVRNEATDQCVLASQCPKKCQRGEILAACGRTCEGTCAKPWRPEICDRIRCASQECRCDIDSGWVRNTITDRCEKINQCRYTQPVCPAYSEMKQCGTACERTCRNPAKRLCKLDASKCKAACSCSEGFVRDETTGNCVREIACPPRHHSHPMITVEPVPATPAPTAGYY